MANIYLVKGADPMFGTHVQTFVTDHDEADVMADNLNRSSITTYVYEDLNDLISLINSLMEEEEI